MLSPGVRLSVRASVTFVSCAKTNKDIFKFFLLSGNHTILVFPYQTGWRYSDGNHPNGGVECKGVWKIDDFRPISRSISETVIVRWAHSARQFVSIEFPFHPYNIQRDCLRGIPRGNKNVIKIAIFRLTHWLKHRITRKLLKIDWYICEGLASIELSFYPCNILRDSRRGVSRGNKTVGCGTWKRRFFCTCGSNNWETVEDRWVHATKQFVSIEFSFHPYNI